MMTPVIGLIMIGVTLTLDLCLLVKYSLRLKAVNADLGIS
jgi:hypothetical protein